MTRAPKPKVATLAKRLDEHKAAIEHANRRLTAIESARTTSAHRMAETMEEVDRRLRALEGRPRDGERPLCARSVNGECSLANAYVCDGTARDCSRFVLSAPPPAAAPPGEDELRLDHGAAWPDGVPRPGESAPAKTEPPKGEAGWLAEWTPKDTTQWAHESGAGTTAARDRAIVFESERAAQRWVAGYRKGSWVGKKDDDAGTWRVVPVPAPPSGEPTRGERTQYLDPDDECDRCKHKRGEHDANGCHVLNCTCESFDERYRTYHCKPDCKCRRSDGASGALDDVERRVKHYRWGDGATTLVDCVLNIIAAVREGRKERS